MAAVTWDAAVVGGGPAGASTALGLARAGRRVLLVDRGHATRFKPGEALPPAARRVLRDLGVLQRVEAGGHHRALGNQSSWGSPELHTHDFLRDPDGCGWHLDRARFDATLRRAAADAGARLLVGARVTRATRRAGGWRLQLAVEGAGDRRVRCRWLIDAGGRGSVLAARLGAKRTREDRLVAFAALCRAPAAAAEDPDAMTLLEAAPDGWWYTARLPRGRRVVVFHTDADLEAAARASRPEGFAKLLTTTCQVKARLDVDGWTLDASSLRGAPAASVRREPFAGAGWLAVGDAAAAFDPLSSQGILTALYGGLQASRAVDAALGAGSEQQRRGLVEAYAADLGRVVDAYCRHRRSYYGAELRWRQRPFWRRRQSPSSRTDSLSPRPRGESDRAGALGAPAATPSRHPAG